LDYDADRIAIMSGEEAGNLPSLPVGINCVQVLTGSKIRTCVSSVLNFLDEKSEADVVIIGRDETLSKTVTIFEIVKRKTKTKFTEVG